MPTFGFTRRYPWYSSNSQRGPISIPKWPLSVSVWHQLPCVIYGKACSANARIVLHGPNLGIMSSTKTYSQLVTATRLCTLALLLCNQSNFRHTDRSRHSLYIKPAAAAQPRARPIKRDIQVQHSLKPETRYPKTLTFPIMSSDKIYSCLLRVFYHMADTLVSHRRHMLYLICSMFLIILSYLGHIPRVGFLCSSLLFVGTYHKGLTPFWSYLERAKNGS